MTGGFRARISTPCAQLAQSPSGQHVELSRDLPLCLRAMVFGTRDRQLVIAS